MKVDLNNHDRRVLFDDVHDPEAQVTAEHRSDHAPYWYYRIDRKRTGIIPTKIAVEFNGQSFSARTVLRQEGGRLFVLPGEGHNMDAEDERETFHVVLGD
jgi:hypothetical protein